MDTAADAVGNAATAGDHHRIGYYCALRALLRYPPPQFLADAGALVRRRLLAYLAPHHVLELGHELHHVHYLDQGHLVHVGATGFQEGLILQAGKTRERKRFISWLPMIRARDKLILRISSMLTLDVDLSLDYIDQRMPMSMKTFS